MKLPAAGVDVPIALGDAQVEPSNEEALMVPELEKVNDDPVSMIIAADVLVPEEIPEKGTDVAETVVVQDKVPEPLV